jgi:hypothetical protein
MRSHFCSLLVINQELPQSQRAQSCTEKSLGENQRITLHRRGAGIAERKPKAYTEKAERRKERIVEVQKATRTRMGAPRGGEGKMI